MHSQSNQRDLLAPAAACFPFDITFAPFFPVFAWAFIFASWAFDSFAEAGAFFLFADLRRPLDGSYSSVSYCLSSLSESLLALSSSFCFESSLFLAYSFSRRFFVSASAFSHILPIILARSDCLASGFSDLT
jgi:hypothetical protein